MADQVPNCLREHLEAIGIVQIGSNWSYLHGGRSNASWHVKGTAGVVVKLFNPGSSSPLFANDPDLEWACLKALAPRQMAPEPIHRGRFETTEFVCYSFANNMTDGPSPVELGHYLKRLHKLSPPAGLPNRGPPTKWITAIGKQFGLPMPSIKVEPQTNAFLHGDPVISNFITTQFGLIGIDWQCPAIGDPCDDIAVVLSPGMQSIYAASPLSGKDIEQFWNGYGNDAVRARYEATAPIYRSVFAAYFRSRGTPDDLLAAKREETSLE
ncbi:MAG: hypothetical protein AAGJ34_10760 [Pseudomonadota bacterium]